MALPLSAEDKPEQEKLKPCALCDTANPSRHGKWLAWGGRWFCSTCFCQWEDEGGPGGEAFEVWFRAKRREAA